MMEIKLKEKIKTQRVLPRSMTVPIRLVVLCAICGVVYEPLSNMLVDEQFSLRHVDVEGGIDCLVTGGSDISMTCTKSDYVGMGLNELDLDEKNWDYSLPTGEKVQVSRVGYSDGIKITASKDEGETKTSVQIAYKNIDLDKH